RASVRQRQDRDGQHRAPALRQHRFQVQQIPIRHLYRGNRKKTGAAAAFALAVYGKVGFSLPGSTSRSVRNLELDPASRRRTVDEEIVLLCWHCAVVYWRFVADA